MPEVADWTFLSTLEKIASGEYPPRVVDATAARFLLDVLKKDLDTAGQSFDDMVEAPAQRGEDRLFAHLTAIKKVLAELPDDMRPAIECAHSLRIAQQGESNALRGTHEETTRAYEAKAMAEGNFGIAVHRMRRHDLAATLCLLRSIAGVVDRWSAEVVRA